MGNCITKQRVHDPAEIAAKEPQIEKRHQQRRSSLGRFAEFLTHQSSVIQDAVSAELPLAAHRGSQEVISLVEGPGYLDPTVWCAGLDVPIVKCALFCVHPLHTLSAAHGGLKYTLLCMVPHHCRSAWSIIGRGFLQGGVQHNFLRSGGCNNGSLKRNILRCWSLAGMCEVVHTSWCIS